MPKCTELLAMFEPLLLHWEGQPKKSIFLPWTAWDLDTQVTTSRTHRIIIKMLNSHMFTICHIYYVRNWLFCYKRTPPKCFMRHFISSILHFLVASTWTILQSNFWANPSGQCTSHILKLRSRLFLTSVKSYIYKILLKSSIWKQWESFTSS